MNDLTLNLNPDLRIAIDAADTLSYALHQNRVPLVRSVEIENRSHDYIRNVTLTITAEPAFCQPWCQPIDLLAPGETLRLRDPGVMGDAEYLAGLTERMLGCLRVRLIDGEQNILAESVQELSALAFDQWPGTSVYPELLAAYCTPNHPALRPVLTRAAELLGQWTGSPSMTGYRDGPERVLQQCAAVYGALQEMNLTYSLPPAGFEKRGQRLRLCDTILESRTGTCIDLAMLCASCLEAIRLHPLVFISKDHALPGVWLKDASFSEAVSDDISQVTKRMADGVGEIAAFESTFLTHTGVSFDEARTHAASSLSKGREFDTIIDIDRARASGVLPLPTRIRGDEGWQIIPEDPAPAAVPAEAPVPLGETVLLPEDMTPQGKLSLWERRMLDLDMRSSLLHLRAGKNLIPLLVPTLHQLESALTGGNELLLQPRPAEWSSDLEPSHMEAGKELTGIRNLVAAELKNQRLRTLLSESELRGHALSLTRAAKLSLEENGANTLFLALGLLRWYEPKKGTSARYAPIALLPVELTRRTAGGYALRIREEDPQMNITLLEMLRQEYGLQLSGLDPLPRKGEHIDLRALFALLRQAVMEHKSWEVVETAFLGIFSFSRFVMWNDMRQRRAQLEQNDIVRSLLEGKLCWKPDMKDFQIPERGLLLPLPADASQLTAIQAASNGQSFVLHGPPGAGKSQTITTMIINALAQGKSVLFVAEKMAALTVVQKRLEEIGAGPFCLELHSGKSRKKDVLDQLQKVLELAREIIPEEWGLRSGEAALLRAELDAYAAVLHTVQPCGRTAYQLIGDHERCSAYPDTVALDRRDVTGLTAADLDEMESRIERLTAAAKGVGHPAEHPLRFIKRTRYAHDIKGQLPEILGAYSEQAEGLLEEVRAFCADAGMDAPQDRAGIGQLLEACKELAFWHDLPAEWSVSREIADFGEGVSRLAVLRQEAEDRKAALLAVWKESFLDLDGGDLLREWQEQSDKWLVARTMGLNALRRRLAPYALRAVPEADDLAEWFIDLHAWRRADQAFKEALAAYEQPEHILYTLSPELFADLQERAQQSAARLFDLTGGDTFRTVCGSDPDFKAKADGLTARRTAFHAAEDAAAGLLELETAGCALGEIKAVCSGILARQEDLKEWMIWNTLANEARTSGLGPVVGAYEGGAAHEEIAGSWRKALYRRLAEEAIDGSEVLSGFSGALFNEKVAQLRRMDERLQALSRQEFKLRMQENLPDLSQEAEESEELSTLRRAIRGGGKGVSIRHLFEQLPTLLPRLCPCMLMSPLSAAQYLGTEHPGFDLVIFDEASQLPTCRAVGALSRGKTAVIVGDPKQMPPTSFFTGVGSAEDDPDIEDLESILDDCLAIGMPETHLLWHYRSRHESLIAFSNSRFYDGRLLTFPSPNDRESKVRLVPVQGVFDRGRGRFNLAEADAVVGELRRRCHDPALREMSVGVVTFNIHQQDCIEEKLNAACVSDPELDAWVNRTDEPLFIKNLENVQGDERDVILFSVGFGPDENGKITMNFGPLNKEGGWRRLNVAVSRARQEMIVFSTLRPADIDLSRTNAEGVTSLRAFLEYAGGRPLALTPRQLAARQTRAPGGVALAISRALAQHGYETQLSVGTSACRIDVAVVDPRCRGRYILGLQLDGESYRDSGNTRDRELGQTAVLQNLGWDLLRVWSMDWWDNAAKELRRILETLDALQSRAASN